MGLAFQGLDIEALTENPPEPETLALSVHLSDRPTGSHRHQLHMSGAPHGRHGAPPAFPGNPLCTRFAPSVETKSLPGWIAVSVPFLTPIPFKGQSL